MTPPAYPARQCSYEVGRQQRAGFSLVEALVALTLTAMCGAVLMLAVETATQSSSDATRRAIARGIAKQMIDEVMGKRYMAVGDNPYAYPSGPNSTETSGPGRSLYNDSDDFRSVASEGIIEVYGRPLGTGNGTGGTRPSSFQVESGYFSNWRQEFSVYAVSHDNPSVQLSTSSTSDTRCVEARVYYREPNGALVLLASLRRVYSYVPSHD